MRKQEYIHTHALLAEITRYLSGEEIIQDEMLSVYDALETRPSSIQQSKQNHREAMMLLSSTIECCLTETHAGGRKESVHR